MNSSLGKTKSPSLTKKKKDQKAPDDSPSGNSPRTVSNSSFYTGNNLNSTTNSSGNVKVVCRVRPFSQKELEIGSPICVNFEDERTLSVKTSQFNDSGPGALTFTYDRVFDMDANQEEVYEFSAKPVVESVLEGFNGTVLAYGQTSSGKTYTMMGPDINDDEYSGIIPRMITTVFDYISNTPDHIEFTVKVSMVEIYMERIRDLLNSKKVNLKVREDKSRGIYIEDVTESYVSDERDVYNFLKYGQNNRATTTTNMNETSSRSHCIFMMTIHQNNLLEMCAKTGKLYLVDLAGSEKVAKTGAVGQVLEEAKEINKSLSALGNVINSLTEYKGHQHIPYRDSKLTRILQESLGGNSRTSLIVNCSPSAFNENETLSALRFGYRAKSIRNTPKINREFTAAQLQVLLDKSEKSNSQKDRKIKLLEGILADHGILLPYGDDAQYAELQTPSELKSHLGPGTLIEEVDETVDGDSDREEDSRLKGEIMSPSKVPGANDQDRVKVLENELRIERLSLGKQTENVKNLKKDLVESNSKMVLIEKENEALINKLATMTLRTQELDEKLKDKEMKLEILQLLKDILMTENEELKKSRKNLLPELDEENNEIVKIAQMHGLMDGNSQVQKDNAQNAAVLLQEFEKRRQDYLLLLENLFKDMVKEISMKLNIKNIQPLKDLATPYFNKLKENYQAYHELMNRACKKYSSDEAVLRVGNQKLQEELQVEKQRNNQIRTEYERVIKEYDNIVKNNIPSFEEWKMGIADSFPAEESIDIKDDTLIFKDFAGKPSIINTNKDSKAQPNQEPAKEKNKNAKPNTANRDSPVDYNINIPQNILNNNLMDKKSPMKTERMINLEKQLHETKELVNQYKSKIESLKTLISTNSNSAYTNGMEDTDRLEGSENFKYQKQMIKQEVLNQVAKRETYQNMTGMSGLSQSSLANIKIVKPIKGGQNKKSSVASQKFFDILKQQYRFNNRNFISGIGDGVLSKQKSLSTNVKPNNELKSKGSL